MTDANDILMGNGGSFVAFKQHGDTVTGIVTGVGEPYQAREWNQQTMKCDGPPKFTKAGKPVMNFHVHLDTGQGDGPDDDGQRTLDVNSWRMQAAIAEACRNAGSRKGLQNGARLTVTYVSDEVPGDARSGKKYTAEYVTGANASLMESTPQPTTPPAQQGDPWAIPAAQPVAAAPATGDADLAELKAKNPALAAALGHLPPAQQAEVLKNAGLAG